MTSLRKVDWDSFRVNFFALFPPGPLDAHAGDLHRGVPCAARSNSAWLPALVQKNPNILAIDIGEIVRQVQGIMDSVSRAVEFVFLFTLAGGLLVLQAAIASTQDERKFDAAILRTLGASQRQLVSGADRRVPAAGRARGSRRRGGRHGDRLGARRSRVQDSVRVRPMVWVYGLVGGALAVTLAGWLGTRRDGGAAAGGVPATGRM